MESVDKETIEKKKLVTTGYKRYLRFLLYPVFLVMILGYFNPDADYSRVSFFLMISIVLYFLLWRYRRLKHDSENLYVIRGNKTQVIPFTSIISIKRSKTKVNSARFWILKYRNELEETRTIRYDASFTKEFRASVRSANPDVIIWEHPHFNH